VKSYRPGMFRSSYRKYERDLKRHATQGWRLGCVAKRLVLW